MAKSGETSSADGDHIWKAVWKLNVPPKIRVFWWQVLHNSLPSKSELKRRHVAQESFCEVCGCPEESLYHVFFSCPVAKRFWAEVRKLSGICCPNLHPCTWAMDILNGVTCSREAAVWMVCGAWTLWTGRNAHRHGRKVWEPGASVRYISQLLEELTLLKIPGEKMKSTRKVRWEKPKEGWMKVNSDAAFDPISCTGSAGVIIRDHMGFVRAAAARWYDGVPDVLIAEALAAKEAIELAIECGFNRIILEIDCQGLEKLLKDRSSLRSSIGGICFDITELCSNFGEFRVEWVPREANSVAHCCVSTVSAIDRCHFWLDDIPEWLERLATEDCNLTLND